MPANLINWIRRIFSIRDDELMLKCGLDGYVFPVSRFLFSALYHARDFGLHFDAYPTLGRTADSEVGDRYFFIRFLRAILLIFVPLMAILVTILLPIDYIGGKGNKLHSTADGSLIRWNVTGLDTLSWQNVDPARTNRYWAHLVCAIIVISWALYRMYREKVNFIDIRQRFLTSPEHRLKASARTVLITNIPSEYRSKEALEALYDVFVDNDDRSKLTVWINRGT